MPDEVWKPVRGHRGYEASSLGRVRSVPRILSDGRKAGGVILAPTPDRDGYLRVKLGRKLIGVHVAVLLAFQGPPEGRHLNGDHLDNSPGNLSWGSRLENERDKWRGKGRKGTEGGEEGKEEKDEEEGRVIGNGSRPFADATEPVTPITRLVSLSEAISLGVVTGTLNAARKARWRDPTFPQPVQQSGLANLYDPQHLADWDSARRGGRFAH